MNTKHPTIQIEPNATGLEPANFYSSLQAQGDTLLRLNSPGGIPSEWTQLLVAHITSRQESIIREGKLPIGIK